MSILFPPQPGKWYLAGPMSNCPQLNIPAFDYAAKVLRAQGWDIISPAELDSPQYREEALKCLDGKNPPTCDGTWGDILARDVKRIADEVTGIIFLDNWTKSRGARLEAFVGLLCGKKFARYYWEEEAVAPLISKVVKDQLTRALYDQPPANSQYRRIS